MFAVLKLKHLSEYKGPSISTYSQESEDGNRYDLKNDEFMLAFAIED